MTDDTPRAAPPSGAASDNPASQNLLQQVGLASTAYKLMPVEPTKEMIVDGQDAITSAIEYSAGTYDMSVYHPDTMAYDGYKAMVARAPGAPVTVLPAEMTPAIREVLGLMISRTGPLAGLFRTGGADIPKRIEDEQAFVLFRFLHLAIEYGADWQKVADADVGAAIARSKANLTKDRS